MLLKYQFFHRYPLYFAHTEERLQSIDMRALLHDICGKEYELNSFFFSRYDSGNLYVKAKLHLLFLC